MNKLQYFFVICFATLLVSVISSCSKDEISNPSLNLMLESGSVSVPSEEISLDLEVRDGRLVFNNLEHLASTLAYLSDNEKRFFTQKALDNWEESIGFFSVRKEYEMATAVLENIETLFDFESFKADYSDVVIFDEDNVPNSKITTILSYVTENRLNSYIMGNEIHMIKEDLLIAIPMSLESRAFEIYENPRTNKDLGILVRNTTFEDVETAQLRDCSSGLKYLESDDDNGDKKIKSQFLLQNFYSAVYLEDGKYLQDIKFWYVQTITSYKKKLWWWGNNKKDEIQFGTGWGAQWDMPDVDGPDPCTNQTHEEFCHGTGWSQTTNQIQAFHTLVEEYTIGAWEACPDPFNREYLYNINFAQNNDVANLRCENSCYTRSCQ